MKGDISQVKKWLGNDQLSIINFHLIYKFFY
jgi:hypothetical protein